MTENRDAGTNTGKYGALDGQAAVGPQGAGLGGSGRLIVLTSAEGTFRLNKERIVIGSVESADVRLSGPGISPIHAVLEMTRTAAGEPSAIIYDLASDTGVKVNGAPAVTQILKSGDKLTIGGHVLGFSMGDIASSLAQIPRERVRESGGRKLIQDPGEDLSPLMLESEHDVREIFDYRPAQKRALEVVMSWHGTILDVEHFVKEKAVTIGTARTSDFGIPPLLSAKRYAIVTRRGEDFVLNLDDRMKGVLQRKGGLENLEQVRAQGSEVVIGNDDFAKVSIGDVDFYMSYTAAPPRLKGGNWFERDALLWKVLGASLALTGVTVNLLLGARVPQDLEAEKLPERLATILYQPEKFARKWNPETGVTEAPKVEKVVQKKPEPTPVKTVKVDLKPNPNNVNKEVPKEMKVSEVKPGGGKNAGKTGKSPGQKEAKEGKGARAKGKEGTRGSKTAKVKEAKPQDKAMRPSPQGGQGSGGSTSQVSGIGNVDFLKGGAAKIADLLSSSSEKLGKGGERLKGFGGFTTQGGGGLALSGSGKGGGGTADSLGGLADKGTGGGKIGTGKGAAGTGSGIVGGQARVAIRSGGPEEAVVMGTIDADAVERALLAHRDEFRLCYEKEINAETPNLAGRVHTSFVIGTSGRVSQAGIESTTLKHPNTERCILSVIRRIDFPIPKGAGVVQVTYPFKFSKH